MLDDMSSAAKRVAGWEDLLAMLEGERGEVVDGVLVVPPRPENEHQHVQGALTQLVGGPFQLEHGRGGPGGWWILAEVNVRLSSSRIVHPDLAGWRRERFPNPRGVRPIDVVPDWCCEIVSPHNASHDRVTKRRLYAEHGVPYYWLVDPEERTLEALVLDDGRWRELGAWTDGDCVPIAPFEAVTLDVGRLFFPLT